jgi:hypothetical protein
MMGKRCSSHKDGSKTFTGAEEVTVAGSGGAPADRGTTRSDDGNEDLWHEELHERRVHHQSGKRKEGRPVTDDESFTGGNGGTEASV